MRYREGIWGIGLAVILAVVLMTAGGCKPAGRFGGGEYRAAGVEDEVYGDTGRMAEEYMEDEGELKRPVRGKIKREEWEKPDPVEQVRAVPGAITFREPAIEAAVRTFLGKPEGDIAPWEVLSVMDLDLNQDIDSVEDLRWFLNLESFSAMFGDLKSLRGIEGLGKLQVLEVRKNKITSLEPVRNLKNLRELDCAMNDIRDYGPLAGLVNLERLCIGDNDMFYTDLSPLKDLKNLKSFYGPWCGIRDISVFAGMEELEYLQLSRNVIRDVSPLAGLGKLQYLDLWSNYVADIEPLKNLRMLSHVNLRENKISEEELEDFYEPKEEDYFVTTVRGRLKEEMPEFTFDIDAALCRETSDYWIRSVTVRENNRKLQVISIPELTCFGQTAVPCQENMGVDMALSLEDVNFDGYKDIRLWDTLNGNYRQEWVYLVWNPETGQFEHDPRLSEISLAGFDQEKKCIYGMTRATGVGHSYYTYRYIDGEIVLTVIENEEFVVTDDENKARCLAMAGVEEDGAYAEIFHRTLKERNPKTGKMEIVKDEYEFILEYLEENRRETITVEADSRVEKFLEELGK